MIIRKEDIGTRVKYWVRPDIENRITEGSIAARFESQVTQIRAGFVMVRAGGAGGVAEAGGSGPREELPADAVYLLTGYRADTDLMVRAGVLPSVKIDGVRRDRGSDVIAFVDHLSQGAA